MTVSPQEVSEQRQKKEIRDRWFLSAPALILILAAGVGPLVIVVSGTEGWRTFAIGASIMVLAAIPLRWTRDPAPAARPSLGFSVWTFARVAHGTDTFDLNLQVRGRHMIANATAALVVSQVAGVDRYAALRELADFGAAEGRGQTIRLGPNEKPLVLVDESYNANVASMNAAMEVFASVAAPGGKKLLVLGDMLELGPYERGGHEMVGLRAAQVASVLLTLGERAHLIAEAARRAGMKKSSVLEFNEFDPLMDWLKSNLTKEDSVLIKGSHGLLMDRIASMLEARS